MAHRFDTEEKWGRAGDGVRTTLRELSPLTT